MQVVFVLYVSAMVDLRQLRAFVAVVDEGTFTDAAISLGTTQATVSRTIAALENELGVRVFRRTSRHVCLTAVGAKALEHARRALDATAALVRATHETEHDIKIGYAWSALGKHTVEVQRRWAEDHPGRALDFVSCNTATAGLAEGLAEIAIIRNPLHDSRFVEEPVGEEARYAVLPRADALTSRRTLALDDFRGRTLAVDPRSGTTGDHLWPSGLAPTHREVHGIEDFLTCIAAGQAVGISSAATREQHRRPGVLYRRVRHGAPIQVALAWWRDDPPPAAENIVALVRQVFTG